MTGCEIYTFITLSCCWLPCVFSPSAGATLGLRLTSSRIQNTHLRPSSLQGPATGSRLQARHPTPSGSSRTLISPFPPARPQHTRVACLPQGTRPHDIGVPDPLLGPSHWLPALGDAPRHFSNCFQVRSFSDSFQETPATAFESSISSYPARRIASYSYH